MGSEVFSKQERADIFRMFLSRNRLKFSDIQKHLGLRSNYLAYHLKVMIEEGIIEKDGNEYSITKDAEKYIRLFPNIVEDRVSPLPVVLIALLCEDKVLMVKRDYRPYKGYWSLIGGRILVDENHKSASARLIKEKSGITAINDIKLCDIVDEKFLTGDIVQYASILFLTKTHTAETVYKEKEGELKWIKLGEMDKHRIIPSDYWLLKNSLDKKTTIRQVRMLEKDGGLVLDVD